MTFLMLTEIKNNVVEKRGGYEYFINILLIIFSYIFLYLNLPLVWYFQKTELDNNFLFKHEKFFLI